MHDGVSVVAQIAQSVLRALSTNPKYTGTIKKKKKRRGRSDAADAIGCKGKVDPFCNPAFGHLEAIRTWEAGDAIWETGRCYDELRDEEVAVGVLDCRDSASCVD